MFYQKPLNLDILNVEDTILYLYIFTLGKGNYGFVNVLFSFPSLNKYAASFGKIKMNAAIENVQVLENSQKCLLLTSSYV